MSRLVLAISILAASAVGASAADLAARPYTKAPPMAVAAYDWSGFYVGGNGGGAWSRECWTADPFSVPLIGVPVAFGGPEGCHTASGATAGGQVGYRWQRAAWVFGLEAQGNWADLTGSNPSQNPLFAGFANRTRVDAIGLFTGQVGYAWNNFLLYVKGGAAVTHDKYDSFLTAPLSPLPTGFVSDRGSETRWGGVVGVGGEYALTGNWSVALEYDHLFMGNRDVGVVYDPAFIAALNHNERIGQDIDMVTARINYRFGGPVVARY
ncbi:MAG: outer membrane beta-barrel protein [Bradyrhizobium sp.]